MKAATYHKIVNIIKSKAFLEKPVLYYCLRWPNTAEGADEYILAIYVLFNLFKICRDNIKCRKACNYKIGINWNEFGQCKIKKTQIKLSISTIL